MRDATHKLSKRDGDAYYSDYIEKGFLTEALVNYLALVGWNPGTDQEFFTLPELVEAFDIHRINKSPGIFDLNKLEWMNSQYVAKMDPDKYLAMATPWFDKVLAGKDMDYRRLAQLMQSRTDIFSRIPEKSPSWPKCRNTTPPSSSTRSRRVTRPWRRKSFRC